METRQTLELETIYRWLIYSNLWGTFLPVAAYGRCGAYVSVALQSAGHCGGPWQCGGPRCATHDLMGPTTDVLSVRYTARHASLARKSCLGGAVQGGEALGRGGQSGAAPSHLAD